MLGRDVVHFIERTRDGERFQKDARGNGPNGKKASRKNRPKVLEAAETTKFTRM